MADRSKRLVFLAAIIGAVILAALPLGLSAYGVSTGIVYFANIALATAWALFSGPTRYISLATAAFVGVGMYTVAIAHVSLNLAVCLALAAIIGFFFAVVVGLSTLRLRGVYFVIFTFGLTELMRQVSSWYEINITNKLNRFITISIDSIVIYEMLLVLAVVAVVGSWYVSTTRLGYALRAIGEDETVARHTGIDATWIKVLVFAIAASMMSLVGGVYALRYPSIDPTVGFGNGWSFQVLIAALLGGPGRPWGPAIGAVLLVLLSDFLVGTFSRYFTIALGVCFVVIVYFIPGGIAPRIEQLYGVLARARQAARSASGASAPQEPPTDAAWRTTRREGKCARSSRAGAPPFTPSCAASPGRARGSWSATASARRRAPCLASMASGKLSAVSSPSATSPSISPCRRHHRPHWSERLGQDDRPQPHHWRAAAGRRVDRFSRRRDYRRPVVRDMPRPHRPDIPARAHPSRHDDARERNARPNVRQRSD